MPYLSVWYSAGSLVLAIARLSERSVVSPSVKPWSASHKLPSESMIGLDEPALMRTGGDTGAGAAFSGGNGGTGIAISRGDEAPVATASTLCVLSIWCRANPYRAISPRTIRHMTTAIPISHGHGLVRDGGETVAWPNVPRPSGRAG